MLAGLSSGDDMRFLTVTQEQFNASLEGYKGLLEFKYRKTFGGYEEVSQSTVTIDGIIGSTYLFSRHTTASRSAPVQYLSPSFPRGTTFTRVATWCAEPLFSRRLSQPSKKYCRPFTTRTKRPHAPPVASQFLPSEETRMSIDGPRS